MMLSNSSGRCFCFFLPDCSQNHHYAADLIRTLSARLFRGCGVIMVYIIMIMLRHGSYPWCAIWGLCWCYLFIYLFIYLCIYLFIFLFMYLCIYVYSCCCFFFWGGGRAQKDHVYSALLPRGFPKRMVIFCQPFCELSWLSKGAEMPRLFE